MKFTWDPSKAAANLVKHEIAFDEAIRAFDDPFALIAPDPRHSASEERRWLIGETETGQCIVVVFTEREGGTVTRLISARTASRHERRMYETLKRVSL